MGTYADTMKTATKMDGLMDIIGIPFANLIVCYGKSLCLMGKSTISMVIFHSYVSHSQRVSTYITLPSCAMQVIVSLGIGPVGQSGGGSCGVN